MSDASSTISPHVLRVLRAGDRVLALVAAVIAASLLVAGWHDVSQGYDVWYYHLPFAARLTGIIDASTYAFGADNAERYAGFPLFGELVQGIVWRITGHVEATSFVSLAGLFAVPLVLRRLFGTPAHLTLLALLAIPLVHIHATAGYVDLPANACVTLLLFVAYRALVRRAIGLRELAGAAGLAAAAANTKFQLVPIVVATSGVFAFVVLRHHRSSKGHLALLALAIPLVFATPLKNALAHGNPVWPIELHVAGHDFPFVERAYSQIPAGLENASRPVRFLHSALELEARPIASKARWSLDQWAPNDDPTCRMGGYFGAYVVLGFLGLAALAWKKRTRETKIALGLFGGVTLVAMLVPQSHELRYYMHWMIFLVALNVVLWSAEGAAARAAVGFVAAAVLAVVVWESEGGYLYASGMTFPTFVGKRTDRAIIEAAAPGSRLCISREPFTFLYAAPFQSRRDYTVQEATRESDCHGLSLIR